MSEIDRYRLETAGLSASAMTRWALSTFGPDGVSFASSLGAEDQVITHLIARHAPQIPVFTLDTGRLYQESHDLLGETRERYHLEISIFFPEAKRVEEMVRDHGPNLFYESVENRKLCCHIRKVEPLGRALSGLKAWIVGLRQEQSVTRQDLEPVDWDETNGLIKISPLAGWKESEVWDFIRKHDIPYHALHDQNFPSLGCAPCTRAVKPGEDARAGRWWWEQPEHKECGLHSGARTRTKTADPANTSSGPFGIRKVETN